MNGSLSYNYIEDIYTKYSHYNQIKNFIETGTNNGYTCKNLSSKFQYLFTVDNVQEKYINSKNNNINLNNITCYFEDSTTFLNNILQYKREDNNCFFLDAHGTGEVHTPLLEELEIITNNIDKAESYPLNIFILNDVRLWNKFNDWSGITIENINNIFIKYNIDILDQYEKNDKYVILTY